MNKVVTHSNSMMLRLILITVALIFQVVAVSDQNSCSPSSRKNDHSQLKETKSQGFRIFSWNATIADSTRKTVYYPWSSTNDDQCKNFMIQFMPIGTFEPMGLVTFMGSGSKWIEVLIQQATGYFISYVGHAPKNIIEKRPGELGLLAPPWEGSTLLYKTHDDATIILSTTRNTRILNQNGELLTARSLSDQLSMNPRGVIIIRNPWKAIFSFYQHVKTGNFNKPEMLKVDQIKESDFVSFMERSGKTWLDILKKWIVNANSISNDLVFIFYEEMIDDPIVQLRKILNSPLLQSSRLVKINEERLECIAKYPLVKFHREPLSVDVKDKLNAILVKYATRLVHPLQVGMEEINSLLISRGSNVQLNYTLPWF